MIVIDEFVRKEVFPQVQDVFLKDKTFEWYWSNVVDDNTCDEIDNHQFCLLYTSPSPRDKRQSRMPSSA